MKATILIKMFLVLPLILFTDYILIAIFGCSTCLFGLGNEFYCGPFCLVGKIIIVLSLVFFGYLIAPDIKKLLKSRKNVKAAESTEG